MANLSAERIHALRWLILGAMCVSLVLVVMSVSALNVSLPTLSQELGASGAELQWIVDAYALVFGGLLLAMGGLGDRYGRRGALQVGMAIFAIGSMAASFAQAPGPLIAARAVMGIGAALIMPATLSIITHVFPGHERAKAISIWAAFAGLGGAIGPVIGGYLIVNHSWQAIFYLNLPVVALALAASVLIVPTSRDPSHARLDVVGALLSIISLAAILFGVIEGPSRGWFSAEVWTGFIVGAAAGAGFIWWEKRTPQPLLPLEFFRDRGFSAGNMAIALAFFVMFAFFFVVTQYMQLVRGYDAFHSALRVLPLAAGLIIAAPSSDRLAARFGAPNVVAGGLFLVALALLGISFADANTSYGLLVPVFIGLGFGMGVAMAPATTIIMDTPPPAKAGVGSAMNDTSREVGGAVGIAVLGSITNSVFGSSMSDRLPAGLTGPVREHLTDSIGTAILAARAMGPDGAALIAMAQDSYVEAMSAAFLFAAVMALIAAVAVRLLLPRRAEAAQASTFALAEPQGPETRRGPAPRPTPAHASVVWRGGGIDQRLTNLQNRIDRLSDELTRPGAG